MQASPPRNQARPLPAAGTRSRKRWWLAVGVLCVLALAGFQAVRGMGDGGGGFVRWRDGTIHGPWRAVFDGHGVSGSRDGVIRLRPRPPAAAGETHAGLVVSVAFYDEMEYSLRLRTVERLRPAPNPWEVAWVVWGYTDDRHFYYLTLKPNGWELGKRDPQYSGGQRFLATGPPGFKAGPWYELSVLHHGATMTVKVGDRVLTTHTDNERPYTRGAVGVYTEDAAAEFTGIGVKRK